MVADAGFVTLLRDMDLTRAIAELVLDQAGVKCSEAGVANTDVR